MIRGNWWGRGPEGGRERPARAASRSLLDALSLHVDEERRISAPLRHHPLALLLGLALLFAILAAHGERQRPEPPLRDFFSTLEAVPEGALFQAAQSLFDLVQRLRFHLDQRELDLVLNICFGALGGVQNPLGRAVGALGPHVPNLLLNLVHDFTPALFQN